MVSDVRSAVRNSVDSRTIGLVASINVASIGLRNGYRCANTAHYRITSPGEAMVSDVRNAVSNNMRNGTRGWITSKNVAGITGRNRDRSRGTATGRKTCPVGAVVSNVGSASSGRKRGVLADILGRIGGIDSTSVSSTSIVVITSRGIGSST
jgi:hypothetical protein